MPSRAAVAFVSARDAALAFIVFVVFAVLIPPWTPQPFADGLDPSWVAGLAVALANGFVFGRDIVFTYGPLGFLATQSYWPGLFAASVGFKLLIALALAILAPLFVRRLRAGAFLLLAAVPALLVARDAIVAVMALALVVLYHGRTMSLAAAIFFGTVFGVLGASKFTYLVLGVVTFALSAAADPMGRRGARRLMLPAMLVSFVIAWFAAGQPLDAIPEFIVRSLELARGYAESMQIAGPLTHVALVAATIAAPLVAIALVLAAGTIGPQGNRGESFVVFVTIAWIGFYVWKQAFTRADGHVLVVIAFGFVASALATAYATKARAARPAWIRPACVAFIVIAIGSSALSALVLIPAFFQAPAWAVLEKRGVNARKNSTAILSLSTLESRLRERWTAQFGAIRAAFPLPALDGAVDVVTWDINRVIASGLDWRPRPVIQSYAAYTPKLASLNADHYESEQGPRYVAIDIKAIDGRYPLLEDPLLWPVLLRRYRPVYLEPMLVVERMAIPARDTTRSVRQVTGARADVPPAVDAAYVRVRIRYFPSLWERVKAVLFRPEPLAMVVTLASGETKRFRYVPGAGTAGFVVSPLVQDTSDLLGVYCGCDAFGPRKQVAAITLETQAGAPMPADAFEFAFEAVDAVGAEGGVRGPWTPAILRMTPLPEQAPLGPALLTEKGRLVRNAHAPSQFVLDNRGSTEVCFGIREDGWKRSEFEGVVFSVATVAADGGESVVFTETLHPTSGTVTQPSACRALPESLRTAKLLLRTAPVRTPAYNWAYWYLP